MLEALESLKQGLPTDIPIYDFKSHKRSDLTRKTPPGDVVLLEGILVFHAAEIRDNLNMKIFVDTDADLRLARRIQRDVRDRGRSVASVIEQYSKFVKPAFDTWIYPTKKFADVIIPRGGDNMVAIDLIVQHIRTKLSMHDLRKIYHNVIVIPSNFQVTFLHS